MKTPHFSTGFQRLVVLCGLALVSAVTVAIASKDALGQCELSCENTDDDIQDVIEQMADLGYGVATGHFELYDPEKTDFRLPFEQREAGFNYLISQFDDGNPFARLGGQDAIVFRGCTPMTTGSSLPSCSAGTNFFFQHYNAQTIEAQSDFNTPTEISLLDASLGDPLTLENIRVAPGDTSLFPAPYDRKTNVVVTGDQQTWEDLNTAFGNAGLTDNNEINLLGIPEDWFIYSESELDTPRDTLTLVYTTYWDPAPECAVCNREIYLNQSFPFYIFYRDQTDPREPIQPGLLSTKPAKYQTTLAKTFKKPFEKMVKEVEAYMVDNHGMQLVSNEPFEPKSKTRDGSPAVGVFEHGAKCLKQNVDCQYDAPQTFYWWDRRLHTLEDDDFYLVVGIDHTQLEAAKFSFLGLYLQENENGDPFSPVDVLSIPELVESYDLFSIIGFPPSLEEVAAISFVVQVGRPDNCVSVPFPGICPDVDTFGWGEPFMFRGDLMMNPETGTQPDSKQLISWRLLHFKKVL